MINVYILFRFDPDEEVFCQQYNSCMYTWRLDIRVKDDICRSAAHITLLLGELRRKVHFARIRKRYLG